MQETYGLTPEQLENRMRGIVEDVIEFDVAVITAAFVEWRRTSPKIPTPFNIRSLCEKIRSLSFSKKRLSDFDGDFNEYKKYLEGEKS